MSTRAARGSGANARRSPTHSLMAGLDAVWHFGVKHSASSVDNGGYFAFGGSE